MKLEVSLNQIVLIAESNLDKNIIERWVYERNNYVVEQESNPKKHEKFVINFLLKKEI